MSLDRGTATQGKHRHERRGNRPHTSCSQPGDAPIDKASASGTARSSAEDNANCRRDHPCCDDMIAAHAAAFVGRRDRARSRTRQRCSTHHSVQASLSHRTRARSRHPTATQHRPTSAHRTTRRSPFLRAPDPAIGCERARCADRARLTTSICRRSVRAFGAPGQAQIGRYGRCRYTLGAGVSVPSAAT